jgi:hypothetical protein
MKRAALHVVAEVIPGLVIGALVIGVLVLMFVVVPEIIEKAIRWVVP